jgi:hypothetical protein
MEYQSIHYFANTTFALLITTLSSLDARMSAAHAALTTTITALDNTITNPDITETSLEALRIEGLAHLERYATLCAEYRHTLNQVDVTAWVNVLVQTPEGREFGREGVEKLLVEHKEHLEKWLEEECDTVDVEEAGKNIDDLVRVQKALLDEKDW